MRQLWRAVDHQGEIPESHVTKTRDEAAPLKFIKAAMKQFGRGIEEEPRVQGPVFA